MHKLAPVHPRTISLGHWLLRLSALTLLGAGLFALVLGLTGRFLPHDERYLGMTARDLCSLHGCRIVHFMIHDRISFGGALVAVGLLYLWLSEGPLRQGQAWAWWALAVSGLEGFGSFFAYLGYGYLDTWHGLANLGLLPCFALGLVASGSRLPQANGWRALLQPAVRWPWHSAAGLGRWLLLTTAAGLVVGGLTILTIGTTCVFVPQDLTFMDLSVAELEALNPRLVPLIAHDRAGFGGAVCCNGLVIFLCVWCAQPSRSLWLVLALAGAIGFGSAIGAHPWVGYNDALHLAPAVLGAVGYGLGLLLTCRAMVCPHRCRGDRLMEMLPSVPFPGERKLSCSARS